MVSPRWRKVLRDVWRHKARAGLVVSAIAIGIAGAGAVLDTWSLMRRVTREGYEGTEPASATIHVDSIDDALLTRVRALPEVRAAEARRAVAGSVWAGGSWRAAMLFAAPDLRQVRIGTLQPLEGEWPTADGAITIEKSSMEFAGVGVGDRVRVQVRDGTPLELPVTGVTRDAGLAPGWMEHVVYAFVTPATIAKLGAPSTMNELRIVVRDRTVDRDSVRRIAFAVRAEAERAGHAVGDVQVPVPLRHIHAAQIDSLLQTQGAFGLLTLLLSGFLVVNLVTAMLAGQRREIGIMKSIGARGSQLARMYLALAAVLGAVACAVAIPIAAAIGRGYATFTANLLNFDIAGRAIPWQAFAVQIAVGLLLPVCAAAVPVIQGARIPVGDALRDIGVDATPGSAPRGWTSRVGGLSRPVLLSLRNAFRRRTRLVLTLLTLATGGAVYLGALDLRASIRGSIDILFAPLRFDVNLRLAEPHRADSIESIIARTAGVARVEAWTGATARVERGDGTFGDGFSVIAPPARSELLRLTPTAGRWPTAPDGDALLVNTKLLEDEPELVLGKTVPLVIGGRAARWTVVGIVESGPQPAAYALRETVAGIVAGGRVAGAAIAATSTNAASQLDLVQRVRAALADAGIAVQSSQLKGEGRAAIEDHLLMVADFLGAMSLLMIIVGGLGLASTMSLAVLERTREIGVLRAIGAGHRSILAIVMVEGLVIGVVSWLIAVPLSLPMSAVLGRAFSRVMLPVPITWIPEWGGVVRWLVVVLVVSLAASAWPARRALRMPTRDALAYE